MNQFLPKTVSAVLVALLSLCYYNSNAQVPIVYYDFESTARNTTISTAVEAKATTVTSPNPATTLPGVGGLTSSNGAGNGAAYPGNNGVGDGYALGYYGFSTSATPSETLPRIEFSSYNCVGFSDLSVSMDIVGIGTLHPASATLYYSTNNVTFTQATLSAGSSTISNSYTNKTFTLGSIANGAILYFRLVGYAAPAGTPTATDGPMRVDNFTIKANTITATTTLPSNTLIGEGLCSNSAVPALQSFFQFIGDVTVDMPATDTVYLGAGNTVVTGTLALQSGIVLVGSSKLLAFCGSNTPITRTSGKIATTPVSTSRISFGIEDNKNGNAFTLPNDLFSNSSVLGGITINRINSITWNNQMPTFNTALILTAGILDLSPPSTITFSGGNPLISRTSGKLTVATTTNMVISNITTNTAIADNAFTTSPATINSLTINTGSTFYFNLNNNPVILLGNFELQNNSILYQDVATSTITVQGNILGSGVQRSNSAGNIIVTGTSSTISPNIIYDNIEFNTTGTVSLTGNTTITGILRARAGTFIVGANTLNLITGNNQLYKTTGYTGLISLGATSHLVFGTGLATAVSNAIFVEPTILGSLTINRGGVAAVTWGSNPVTIAGDLTLTSGILSTNGTVVAGVRRGDITVNGNIAGTSGSHISGAFASNGGIGKIVMTGNAGVATIAGLSYGKVELNNANGFSLTGSAAFNDSLTLTAGSLAVGNNTLSINQNYNRTPIIKSAGSVALSAGSSLSFGTSYYSTLAPTSFTIPASLFTPTNPEITNLKIARRNPIVLNSQNFGLSGILSLDSGQVTLPSNYLFTLRSTSITNTAMVNTVGTKASIIYGTGAAFRVERFIPKTGNGIRAYRDISPSVNSGTSTIFDNWQEGATNGLDNGYYYGTHITGIAAPTPGGNDATTGLDKNGTGFQSLHMMKINTTSGLAEWEIQTSTKATKDSLSALRGYRILVRGNRLMNLYQSPQPTGMNSNAILRSKGKIIIGDVVYTTTGITANGATNTAVKLNFGNVNGFTMLGNPYAAPIVWDSIANNSTNVQPTYWMFDPNVGTEGAYVTYNTITGSNNGSSAANKYIQPGEAFFIKNNASLSPSLTIKETFKAANAANLTLVYRNTDVATLSKIAFTLKKQVTDRGLVTMDGAVIAFDSSFSNTIGQEDGAKFSNNSDNFGIVSNYTSLSIEGRKPATTNDTMQLRTWAPVIGTTYTLEINTLKYQNTNNLQAYLLDRFTNTQTTLNMAGINTYNFTVATDTSSYNWRFKLVFKSNNTLPVKFISINAAKVNDAVSIDWNINESNMKTYTVERSANTQEFAAIATVHSKGNGNNKYAALDNNPLKVNSYYRIAAINADGTKTYSPIVLVKSEGKIETVNIYPNPVKEKTINLQLSNIAKGDYSIEVINTNGQRVYSNTIKITNDTQINSLQLPSQTQQGTYLLRLSNSTFSYQQKIVVE